MDTRRLGSAMTVFGLIGVLLAGIMATALVAGVIAARNLDERVAAAQVRLGASLSRLTLTIDSVSASLDNATGTVTTSRDAVIHAATVLGEAAATTDSIAAAVNIEILTQRPLAGAAAQVTALANDMRTFQTDATTLAAHLDSSGKDITQIGQQLQTLRGDVSDLAAAIASFTSAREVVGIALGGIALGGLLTAWIAVLAGAIAWAGWRIRKTGALAGAGDIRR